MGTWSPKAELFVSVLAAMFRPSPVSLLRLKLLEIHLLISLQLIKH